MVTATPTHLQAKSPASPAPPPRLHLIVPALNEADNLPRLFDELIPVLNALHTPWQLLIVDDGSTDLTAELTRKAGIHHPIHVLCHTKNLGPGAAFMTGFQHILPQTQDDDAIVTLEADTTSDVTLLPQMLALHAKGIELVLASVYHPNGGLKHTTPGRRLLSTTANTLIRNVFRLDDIYTFSSFYRVYRAGTLKKALGLYGRQLMAEPGFASVVELLIKIHRMGADVAEVPMILDSTRRIGQSRMKVLRTARAWVKLMVRLNLEPPPMLHDSTHLKTPPA